RPRSGSGSRESRSLCRRRGAGVFSARRWRTNGPASSAREAHHLMLDGRNAKGSAGRATLSTVQPLLAYAAAHLDDDVSLCALADKANLSAFYLHRIFLAAVGETPKQFTMRLRLGHAAARLLTTDDSILNVALACGFQSHEVFVRAFRRAFGIAPGVYRRGGFANPATVAQARKHAALVSQVGPCIALYHIDRCKEPEMTYTVERKEISPQSVLMFRRRVKSSEIGLTLAEVLPRVFKHAQQAGA